MHGRFGTWININFLRFRRELLGPSKSSTTYNPASFNKIIPIYYRKVQFVAEFRPNNKVSITSLEQINGYNMTENRIKTVCTFCMSRRTRSNESQFTRKIRCINLIREMKSEPANVPYHLVSPDGRWRRLKPVAQATICLMRRTPSTIGEDPRRPDGRG
jgi:hypothetical protein